MTSKALRRMLVPLALFLGTLGVLPACSEPNALLLKVSASRRVDSFDFVVRDLQAGENVAETSGQAIPADQDISQPGQELKLAVRFLAGGSYLVHLVGRDAGGTQVGTRAYRVDGTVSATLQLVDLPAQSDLDTDGFPDAAACAALGAAGLDCEYADCDDHDPRVNPLAQERCNGRDDDCDGSLGPTETDADGDGYLQCADCDPSDETDFNPEYFDCNDCDDSRADIHPASRRDPVAHPAAVEDCTNCGDGVDHNCDGKLTDCNDADCDGWPGCDTPGAPAPPLCDCDDDDESVHPGATEVCGDQVDNNCDGQKDEGCLPCDIDGDGFLRDDPDNGCLPPAGEADCDDTDSGIFPGAADPCGGKEGGCRDLALRGYCRDRDGADQPIVHDCRLRGGDQGCPPVLCDADGDGFMRYDPANGCEPPAVLADCDDDDPHTFPGAPDRCGDGKAQNCNLDTPCSDDQDGDGYNAADDCDDGDATVHPWATEVCNGQDDDCDGVIDEGNPDGSTGQTVAGTSCTDNDLGECGKKRGSCICSRTVPVGTRSSTARQACRDEDVAAAASPRCFGAGQPVLETAQSCDGLDQDCDGVNDDAPDEVPCATGTACKWTGAVWKCACDTATGCSGCCMHGSPDYCVYIESVTVGQCGAEGVDCHSCSDANPCTSDICDVGVCRNDNYADHASCPGGQCRVPSGGGAAQCCGTCWTGSACAAASVTACGVGGGDCAAANTDCGLCRVCDGGGSCGTVAAGQDPNNQCPDDGVAGCGRTGVCDGGGACALYTAGTACATCKTCDGSGHCQNVPNGQDPNNQCADEASTNLCGLDGFCNGGGACRYYPAGKKCALCTTCNGSGSCNVKPADDSNCGVIDCDQLDSTCRNYNDLTNNRCLAVGQCKPANQTASCTDYTNASGTTVCGTCLTCDAGACTAAVPPGGASAGACTDQGATTCGTNGFCDGSAACQYYSTTTRCAVCKTCSTSHTCSSNVADNTDPSNDCGTCRICDGGGACRAASAGTDPKGNCAPQPQTGCGRTGDCDGSGACALWPSGTDCGTCATCSGSGACNVMPADDTACGTIACSTLSTTCRTYSDLTSNRCKALSTCKAVNATDCTSYVNADPGTACGPCHQCNGSGGCDPVDNGTNCGTCLECQGGSCVPVAAGTQTPGCNGGQEKCCNGHCCTSSQQCLDGGVCG